MDDAWLSRCCHLPSCLVWWIFHKIYYLLHNLVSNNRTQSRGKDERLGYRRKVCNSIFSTRYLCIIQPATQGYKRGEKRLQCYISTKVFLFSVLFLLFFICKLPPKTLEQRHLKWNALLRRYSLLVNISKAETFAQLWNHFRIFLLSALFMANWLCEWRPQKDQETLPPHMNTHAIIMVFTFMTISFSSRCQSSDCRFIFNSNSPTRVTQQQKALIRRDLWLLRFTFYASCERPVNDNTQARGKVAKMSGNSRKY